MWLYYSTEKYMTYKWATMSWREPITWKNFPGHNLLYFLCTTESSNRRLDLRFLGEPRLYVPPCWFRAQSICCNLQHSSVEALLCVLRLTDHFFQVGVGHFLWYTPSHALLATHPHTLYSLGLFLFWLLHSSCPIPFIRTLKLVQYACPFRFLRRFCSRWSTPSRPKRRYVAQICLFGIR